MEESLKESGSKRLPSFIRKLRAAGKYGIV